VWRSSITKVTDSVDSHFPRNVLHTGRWNALEDAIAPDPRERFRSFLARRSGASVPNALQNFGKSYGADAEKNAEMLKNSGSIFSPTRCSRVPKFLKQTRVVQGYPGFRSLRFWNTTSGLAAGQKFDGAPKGGAIQRVPVG